MKDVNAGDVYKLGRILGEIALAATAEPGEKSPPLSTAAIVEDVGRHPGSCISDIAQRTRLAQSLVSTTVSRLTDKGVFAAQQDPTDRRRTVVFVVPEATRSFKARGARTVTDAIAQVLPDATPGQLARIESTLDRLAEQLLR